MIFGCSRAEVTFRVRKKKGEIWSTLTYFITDEMYEQAVPII